MCLGRTGGIGKNPMEFGEKNNCNLKTIRKKC